ncbi:MAG: carbon-nitrogen hydrolase family protein, partial [Candidatus Thiodiazotropha sp. (ex Codakia orbicularis)]|nr:carbon-nitrogen hydrolase family protein [Candidatus Thiodiazotropha sp. (ex Codakia orbicularis)]
MSAKKNKVAALQMASSPNVSANLLEAERLIGEAAESGAGLVVLPENFAFKGEHDRDM